MIHRLLGHRITNNQFMSSVYLYIQANVDSASFSRERKHVIMLLKNDEKPHLKQINEASFDSIPCHKCVCLHIIQQLLTIVRGI